MIEWLFANPKVFIYLAVVGAITIVICVVFAGCWLFQCFAGQDEERMTASEWLERFTEKGE